MRSSFYNYKSIYSLKEFGSNKAKEPKVRKNMKQKFIRDGLKI